MSDRAVEIVRWVLLASVVLNLLQATVLFGAFQRRAFRPWAALNERAGARVPVPMRDARMQRAWPFLMAAALLAAWWYLGTPAGADTLRHAWR